MVKGHYLDGKIIVPKRAIPREQERTSRLSSSSSSVQHSTPPSVLDSRSV
ncbi:uncharacterized protein BDZ99DRAFT_514068 [Mytilinidion resinicola]|uniref:Uncharacterized protein n=1 Tax=Mytilinidion resinicola TaxID=574789 RepID=A0A6A6ZC14_9PEZI|nr:uncharacterized protein BDZ99DRAFT_514068 [Mytilinidion resinicola]KAF2817855.1 hypothetical protein BDZ99DRAFT_514068 [Mytilinidion resinicola]